MLLLLKLGVRGEEGKGSGAINLKLRQKENSFVKGPEKGLN